MNSQTLPTTNEVLHVASLKCDPEMSDANGCYNLTLIVHISVFVHVRLTVQQELTGQPAPSQESPVGFSVTQQPFGSNVRVSSHVFLRIKLPDPDYVNWRSHADMPASTLDRGRAVTN